MPDALKLDLSPVKSGDLEDAAEAFDEVSRTWEECERGEGLGAYFSEIARAFREESACRSAGVLGGMRLVEADLAEDGDDALKRAISLVEEQWDAEHPGEGFREFLAVVAAPIATEYIRRRAIEAAEKTDTVLGVMN